jgi:hypothetical protein
MAQILSTTQAAPARPFRYGWIVLGVAAFIVRRQCRAAEPGTVPS